METILLNAQEAVSAAQEAYEALPEGADGLAYIALLDAQDAFDEAIEAYPAAYAAILDEHLGTSE